MFFRKRSATPESPQEPTTLAPPATEDLGPLALLHQKIVKTDLPEEVADQAESELKKLEKTDSVSAEYTIGINYIETLISIPWFALSTDNLDMDRAEKMFSRHHYGLAEIKDRILDFLAAKTLRSLAKPRMLIVDDESIAQENLRHYFTKQGLEVMTANNGKDALEIIAHHP